MKYIISESRIANVMKHLINTVVLGENKNKFKFVGDIKVHKTGEDEYEVKVLLDRKKTIELSSGFGEVWSKLSTEIRSALREMFGGEIKIKITHNIL